MSGKYRRLPNRVETQDRTELEQLGALAVLPTACTIELSNRRGRIVPPRTGTIVAARATVKATPASHATCTKRITSTHHLNRLRPDWLSAAPSTSRRSKKGVGPVPSQHPVWRQGYVPEGAVSIHSIACLQSPSERTGGRSWSAGSCTRSGQSAEQRHKPRRTGIASRLPSRGTGCKLVVCELVVYRLLM